MGKIVASIQARLGSSRLPGKVLKEINGKPMLYWQVERIKKSLLIDELVIATTTSKLDDKIEEFCKEFNIKCYRGSENDVLDRIASMLTFHEADLHVEFFGDSPLVEAEIVDQYIGLMLKKYSEIDFISNHQKTTFPPGSEVIVYKAKALIEANSLVPKEDVLREHVTIHITNNKEKFKVLNIEAPAHYNFPDLYLEVDTQNDFEVIQKIFGHLSPNGEHFTLRQVIDFLILNPNLAKVNSQEIRRWKEFRNE